MKNHRATTGFFFLAFFLAANLFPCTSYLVTPGASADGSAMITYAADSHIRYGELYHFPGGPREAGSYFQVTYRGSHKPLGRIPHPPRTHAVVGFMNEKQVAIGETTFGGRKELKDEKGEIDYGSLMFLALQRASTAREAIRVMVTLVAEYGYYSDGQSFSIADPREVWLLEMIGKGTRLEYDRRRKTQVNADRGAVWVARRIPDGFVSAHANQARIAAFPQADGRTAITCRELDRLEEPQVETVYAHDVISFARRKDYFRGEDAAFSFADAYAPADFGTARFCDARVWSFFKEIHGGMDAYRDAALGLDPEKRLPLYVRPDRKLTAQDLMRFKRDHLEGTPYDMAADVGAGPGELPYRWRPLTWTVDGVTYFHERTTATQQTAFSFIAQCRASLPDPIGGILWFGVDDAATTVYVPMFAGIKKAPEAYAEGFGSIIEYEPGAAFWAFNQVAHLAYLRYNLIRPDIRKVQAALEERFRDVLPAVEQAALALHDRDPEAARDFLTDVSAAMGNTTVERWRRLYGFLLVKHLDGNVKKEVDGVFQTNEWGRYPIVEHPGYPEWWRRLIIEKTGDRFRLRERP